VSVWRTHRSRPREQQYFNLFHDYVAWAANNHSLQQLAATFDIGYALTGSGEAEEIHGAVAIWNLFEVAGVNAESGRLFQREDVNGTPACWIAHSIIKFGLLTSDDPNYNANALFSPVAVIGCLKPGITAAQAEDHRGCGGKLSTGAPRMAPRSSCGSSCRVDPIRDEI